MSNNIKVALVIDEGETDGEEIQVVDLEAIQRLDSNLFIIQTKPFNSKYLSEGAGNTISKEHIISLLTKK